MRSAATDAAVAWPEDRPSLGIAGMILLTAVKILYTPLLIVPSLSVEERAAILEAAGPDALLVEAPDAARQKAEIADTEALFGRVSPETFTYAKRLRYYHAIGAGVDSVLSTELVQSDVILVSEKGEVGIHLAEHAFALLLALTRGLHTAVRAPDYRLRESIRKDQLELYGLTMGIVGFGGTGREVARRALAFGMRVVAVDIEDVAPEPGVEAIWKPDRLPDLLATSDVVVIGLPLTKATHHLFTRDLFRRMKPGAILINVTRGAIVHGDHLLEALDSGLIGGAGLDVTDPEPLPAGHRLWAHPRAIVTPHTAGGSPRRAGRAISRFCENLRRWRSGEPLIGIVDKQKGY
jgi:phosphoglycerate dehydrogenase-like enzyme